MRKAEFSRKTAETALTVRLDLDGTGRFDNRDRRRLLRPHARPARAACADRPRGAGDGRPAHRRPPHRRGRRHRARPGARAGARRQGGDPALRRLPAADGRGAGARGARPLAAGRSSSGTSTSRAPKIGSFDVELVREFFTAFAMNARHHAERRPPRRRQQPPHRRGGVQGGGAGAARGGRARPARRPAVPSTKGTLGRMTTVIVDYESGNLHSAEKSFQRMAARGRRRAGRGQRRPRGGGAAPTRIVLPGVGAFADCRAGLAARAGLFEAIERAGDRRGRAVPRHLRRAADDGEPSGASTATRRASTGSPARWCASRPPTRG